MLKSTMDAKRPKNIVFYIFTWKGLYGIPRLGEGAIGHSPTSWNEISFKEKKIG